MISNCRIVYVLLFSIAALFMISGCDDGLPKRYPVSGTVVFEDGSPVKTGSVELAMAGNQWTASGKIERDGSFVLSTIETGDGAIVGTHKAIVRQLIVAYYPVEGKHDHGHLVAEKYADFQTTDLTIEVKPGPNKANLQVEKKLSQK